MGALNCLLPELNFVPSGRQINSQYILYSIQKKNLMFKNHILDSNTKTPSLQHNFSLFSGNF